MFQINSLKNRFYDCFLRSCTGPDVNYMVPMKLALDHTWIGGRTIMSKDGWKWMDENGEVLSRNGIGTGGSWCLDKNDAVWPYADSESCLNLDREGHGVPLFYGLPCNTTSQYVLCNLSARKNMHLAPIATKNETSRIEESIGKNSIEILVKVFYTYSMFLFILIVSQKLILR